MSFTRQSAILRKTSKLTSDTPDKEDRELLASKSRNYVIGWNRVKHRGDKYEPERTVEGAG